MRGIYKIVNRENGKYYVGSSANITKRWTEHRRSLQANAHVNPKLQASWNIHGENNFDFVVVEEVSGRLLEAEQRYLDIAKQEPSRSYNLKHIARGWDWETDALAKSLRRGERHGNYCHNVHTFIHSETGQTFTGTRCNFYQQFELDKTAVRKLVRGVFEQTGGWKLCP